MLVLERGEAATLIGISLREMEKGGGTGRAHVAPWRRMGLRQVGAEVCLVSMPTLEPPIGGGDGKREVPLVPNSMKGASLNHSCDQLKEVDGGDAGARD